MREQTLRNLDVAAEFHIYMEHDVDVPVPAKEAEKTNVEAVVINSDSSSSTSSTDDGGYDSVEDELYKPPKEHNTSDTESDEEVKAKKRQIAKGKRPVGIEKKGPTTMKVNQKGKGVVINEKGSTRRGPRAASLESQNIQSSSDEDGSSSEEAGAGQMPTSENGVRFYQPLIHSSDEDYVYEYESKTLHTPVSSEEEYRKHAWPEFRHRYAFGEGHFEIGTKFATLEDFKDVVKDQFITNGRDPKWIKVDTKRVRVGCLKEKCGWLAHCSKNSTLRCFQVKTYINNHICARGLGSNAADQNWLSRKIEKRLVIHPHMSKKEAQAFLKEDFKVTPHEKMVYRALRLARERLVGSEKEQYAKFRGYLFELM